VDCWESRGATAGRPLTFSANAGSPAARRSSFLTKSPTPAEVAAAAAEVITLDAAEAAPLTVVFETWMGTV